jgi:UPF0716 family protein affecting phage T7 exclusion
MLGRLLLILLLFPIAEIYVLVQVHHSLEPQMGGGDALLLIFASLFFSFLMGMRVTKVLGMRLLLQTQQKIQQGTLPNEKMLENLVLIVAGLAFIFPGYISDVFGILLLLPWVRRLLAKGVKSWLANSMEKGQFKVYHASGKQSWQATREGTAVPQGQGAIIDVEAIDSKMIAENRIPLTNKDL